MDNPLQLAVITNDHYRTEAISKVAAGLNWHVLACINHPQPREWVGQQRPDLILVDLDLPGATILLGELARMPKSAPILALATPQHLAELQNALLAGATSFVAFPLDPGQFIATVMRTVEDATQQADGRRGRIVAVVGLKGGVGRTTLAVNLAVAVRRHVAGDVILVEAHHGLGDAALMLNLLPRHTLASLAQETNIDVDVIQGHLLSHASRVRALMAPPDLAQLVEIPVETWRHILHLLAEIAPYVIVDTAALADAVLSEVLMQADDLLLVTGPDLASLRSAVVLLKTLDEEGQVHARPHVVLNRAGIRGGISEQASQEQVGEKIAASIPDDPALVTYALNRGVPFVASHPRSILSREIDKLVEQSFGLKPVAAKKLREKRSLLSVRKPKQQPAAS